MLFPVATEILSSASCPQTLGFVIFLTIVIRTIDIIIDNENDEFNIDNEE